MSTFPSPFGNDERPTLDTLHVFAKLAGRVRRELSPPHPHWWHASLFAGNGELTTGEMNGANRDADPPVTLTLDLGRHRLRYEAGGVEKRSWPLGEGKPAIVKKEVPDLLIKDGLPVELPEGEWDGTEVLPYDEGAATRIRDVMDKAVGLLRRFRNSLTGECGPLQLWPHHFDLAFVRFTGRTVPGADPGGPESSREQVNHGFTFGDTVVGEPYFYVVPYPVPEGLRPASVPGSRLLTEGFTGYVLPWARAADSKDPDGSVKTFLSETTGRLKEVMER